MSRRRLVLPLQLQLVLAFAVLIAATALAIVGTVEGRQRAATVDLAQQLVARTRETVAQRTVAFLSPGRETAALLADTWRHEGAVAAGDADLQNLAESLLRVYPQLASSFAADEQGQMVQVRRGLADAGVSDEVLLRRVVTQRPEGGAVERFWRIDLPDSAPTLEREVAYDPRVRPWYTAAVEARGPAWTEPYVFSTTGAPGITAVEPVFGADGVLLGVVGVDITLGDLSSFLARQRVGARGRASLVDAEGRVIVSPEKVALDLEGLAESLTDGDAHELRIEGPSGDRLVSLTPLRASTGTPWTLVIVAYTDDFLGSTHLVRDQALIIAACILLLGVALSFAVSRAISRPIAALSERVTRIRRLEFDNDFSVSSGISEVVVMSRALARMQAALVSFSRYASAGLVQTLMLSGEVARLGGEERTVSVLFSDLRGYSTLAERLSPIAAVELLNTYFSAMQTVIEAHEGVVLEYVGDAILVVFGAPVDLPGHAEAAARCALAMDQALHQLNERWAETGFLSRWPDADGLRLGARIGVHTGPVVAGNLGSHTHMKYGIVGDTVNVAARLEALNKELGTSILISGATYALLPEALRSGAVDRGELLLKGRTRRVLVYELLASGPPPAYAAALESL